MTGVPESWKSSTLGELGRYLNGRAFKKSEWRDRGRPIIRIQNLTGSGESFNYFEGDIEDRYVARPGDLLVSWAATLGAFIWSGPEAVVNQHIFKVESNIDVRFHKYLLDFKLEELMRHTHGSGMVHITRGKFDSLPVSIPHSNEEQRRIVEILEDHLSRLDAAMANVNSCLHRAQGWRRSAIDRVVWRKREEGPVAVADLLAEKMRNGHSARASTTGAGVRALTLTSVTRNSFTESFTKIVAVEAERVRDLWLRDGDILVQRSNTPELVGTTAIYRGPNDWAIFPDLLIRLRANESRVSPAYLAAVMRTERVHRRLRTQAKGLAGSMPKIDQAAIGSVLVPVPSVPVQQDIVSRVAEIEDASSQFTSEARTAGRRGERLRRALLAAAFSGRLT